MSVSYPVRNTSRPGPGAEFLHVLDEMSFKVAHGEFVSIIGPSGCGKSTLLNSILGLIKPNSGEISVDGAAVVGPSADVAMVFQAPTLLPWRKVLKNVMYSAEGPARGLDAVTRRKRAEEALELVGLTDFAGAYPAQLSGGMQQRVNLARALICQPKLMLMDEPFAALDAQLRARMQKELLSVHAAQRSAILFVTHDVREAAFLADRVVVFTQRPSSVFRVFDNSELPPRPRTGVQVEEIAEKLTTALQQGQAAV